MITDVSEECFASVQSGIDSASVHELFLQGRAVSGSGVKPKKGEENVRPVGMVERKEEMG
jgi:hypothetical protein